MRKTEIDNSKSHQQIESINYVANSVVRKTIIRKPTGNVCVIAIDKGETLAEKIIPFDNFIQIIDGDAELVFDEHSTLLKTGESIIVPAHTSLFVKANKRFKMISTVIKSGYEGNNVSF